jgi:hypothetical protein
MLEVFCSRGASLHQLNSLAEWVRENVAKVRCGKLDVIKFVELDLPHFLPGFYLEIEDDHVMGRRKAYIAKDAPRIVVAESIYNRACAGNLEASETILHEVGHLFLHDKYKSLGLNDAHGRYKQQIKDTNAGNSAEWQAKAFAMCLLFPYSYFRKYNDRLEFQVYFDLSVEQSNRVLAHLKKLRLRDGERSSIQDRRWVKSVVSALWRAKSDTEETKLNDQLDLFYRKAERQAA